MIINGKALADKTANGLKSEIDILKIKGVIPTLGVIFVKNSAASLVYVEKKKQKAEELGIGFRLVSLKNPTEKEIIKQIKIWNTDPSIHGIIIQLPLPNDFNTDKIIEAIDPQKDVDGLTSVNVGRLSKGMDGLFPATALGVMEILKSQDFPLSGKKAVIVGRSDLVGKPLAQMLLAENVTVTLAHSKTESLGELTRQADILISAVGRPGLIKADMVKRGAVVIDVGTTVVDGKIRGDLDFGGVKDKAALVTPVPGGVGPLTVIMLMSNAVKAAKSFQK